jgi:hypothetical protein
MAHRELVHHFLAGPHFAAQNDLQRLRQHVEKQTATPAGKPMPFEKITLPACVSGGLQARRRSEMEAVPAAHNGHGA